MSPKLLIPLTCWLGWLVLSPSVAAQCEIELAGPGGESLDQFGRAVALQPDRLAVGAPGVDDGTGAVCLLTRQSVGDWVVQQTLLASDGEPEDAFGWSLALSGDRLVIGAPLAGSGADRFGAAYVYRFDGSVWQEEQKLQAGDAAFDDAFGTSVAIDGELILVGSPDDDDQGPSSGSLYLFRFDGTSWIEETKLTAPGGTDSDALGTSVALRADLAAGGAPGDDDLGESAGAVHLFRNDGSTWSHEAKLVASTGTALDYLGSSLATSGDLLLTGAYGADPAGAWSGTAYLFSHDGGQWSELAELRPSDADSDQLYGWSVALEGSVAVVGAPGDATRGHRAGAVYVWVGSGPTWQEDRKLVAANGDSNDLLGAAVATEGYQALAGAPQADGETAASGSVSLFDRAAWENYGAGWPGTDGIPDLLADGPPVVENLINIEIGNSLGQATSGVLFAGTSTASISGGLGGTLLVAPAVIAPISIPAAGLSVGTEVPADLEGYTVYLQVLEIDPGASAGVSFTPGLALRVCGW